MPHTRPANTKGTLTVRSGASRSLLARKANAKLKRANHDEGIEAVFPKLMRQDPLPTASGNVSPKPVGGGPEVAATERAPKVSAASPRALGEACSDPSGPPAAASKVASPPLLGKRSSVLILGGIKPNAGTVFSVITDVVRELGRVPRAELLVILGSAKFPQTKARPEDQAWCQGYVAGAIRSGFLQVVAPSDTSEVPAANVKES